MSTACVKRARDAADDADVGASGARTNDRFEAYYRVQGVCADEDDFARMMRAFQTPLPLTFRVNASSKLLGAIRRRLERDVLPALAREGTMRAPKCVGWYPERLAFQIDVARDATLKASASRGGGGVARVFKASGRDWGVDASGVGEYDSSVAAGR